MALFDGRHDPTGERYDALMEELAGLKRNVAELRGERDSRKRVISLEKEYESTKRELVDLQIEFDREKEKHEHEKRETEHMVGLQRKRGEFETEAAGREAKLVVREENLQAAKDRFDEHVAFIEKRFDQQFDSLNGLMEKFLERMPTTRQLITVGGKNGDDEGE
jgi:predicted  nucleic acid-binding Zn-ribbon protein